LKTVTTQADVFREMRPNPSNPAPENRSPSHQEGWDDHRKEAITAKIWATIDRAGRPSGKLDPKVVHRDLAFIREDVREIKELLWVLLLREERDTPNLPDSMGKVINAMRSIRESVQLVQGATSLGARGEDRAYATMWAEHFSLEVFGIKDFGNSVRTFDDFSRILHKHGWHGDSNHTRRIRSLRKAIADVIEGMSESIDLVGSVQEFCSADESQLTKETFFLEDLFVVFSLLPTKRSEFRALFGRE